MSKCFPGNVIANEIAVNLEIALIAVNTFAAFTVTIIIITIDGNNYHVIVHFNIKTNIDRQ